MTDNPVYLTEEGLKKLKEELEYLVNIRRKEVAKQIAEAKAEGDISENAGYDEAKNAQAFLEGKIRELEIKLKNAHVIDDSMTPANEVALGRTVIVCESEAEDKEVYTIVGSTEADPGNGRISNESPLGKSLLGKKVGDKVVVKTPGGEIEFTILGIE